VSSEEVQTPRQMDLDEPESASAYVSARRGPVLHRASVDEAPEDLDRAIEAPFLPPGEEVTTRLVGTVAAVLDSRSVVTEHFRVLATKLQMKLDSGRPACIGVVSAAAGEGKTTVSVGLAHAFTRTVATRVALLDCDLRRPAVARYLGLERAEGIGEWLDNRAEGIQLHRHARAGFVVATAGDLVSRRFDLLGTPPMLEALEAARRAYDFTLLDLPPLMPVADAVTLQDHLDGLVLVVRSRRCPTETIQAAVSRLRKGKLLGLVLNDQRDIIPGYYSYASRRYGKD
jgi:Mrp family chromosome partitioning ATPase